MRVPLSWLRDYVDLPADVTARDAGRPAGRRRPRGRDRRPAGADIAGPLVVGRVLGFEEEPQSNGKTDPLVPGRRRRGASRAASSAARSTSPSATSSSSRCPARCCPAASRSPRARPTATSATA